MRKTFIQKLKSIVTLFYILLEHLMTYLVTIAIYFVGELKIWCICSYFAQNVIGRILN